MSVSHLNPGTSTPQPITNTQDTSRTQTPPNLHPIHTRFPPPTLRLPLHHLPHPTMQTRLRLLIKLRLVPARRDHQIPCQTQPPLPNLFLLLNLVDPLPTIPRLLNSRPIPNSRHPQAIPLVPNRRKPHQLRPTHPSKAHPRFPPGNVIQQDHRHIPYRLGEAPRRYCLDQFPFLFPGDIDLTTAISTKR